jgi:hypothetical protein
MAAGQKEIERKIFKFFTREFEKAGANFIDVKKDCFTRRASGTAADPTALPFGNTARQSACVP